MQICIKKTKHAINIFKVRLNSFDKIIVKLDCYAVVNDVLTILAELTIN